MSGQQPLLVFRVDANSRIGGGHMARCMALAEALRCFGWRVVFIVDASTPLGAVNNTYEGIALSGDGGSDDDSRQTLQHLHQLAPQLVLIDGYHFTSAYRSDIAADYALACFDDLNDGGELHAELIINALPTANALGYPATSTCLLGCDFTVLPPAIVAAAPGIDYQHRSHWLVCFGAADPCGYTQQVIDTLAGHVPAGVVVDVVCGGLNPSAELIAKRCQAQGWQFYYDHQDMAGLLSQAALAVAAPGALLNELALMAVPSIFIIAAANQYLSAEYHQQKRWCQVFAGDAVETACLSALALWQQPKQRSQMSLIAQQQIDGLGSRRVADHIAQRYGGWA